MERDEYYSFKKAGAIPFKWEIRPGVPKIQDPQLPFEFEFPKHQNDHETKKNPFPPKLKPPPNGLYYHPQSELQTLFSSSNRVGLPVLARAEVVSSSGCSPMKKRQNVMKKRTGEPRSRSEPEYYSDHDTSPRWSVSSRNSISPLSSPFASYRSSPRPAIDSDWAAFGLF